MGHVDFSYAQDAKVGPRMRVDLFHSGGIDHDQLTDDLGKSGYQLGVCGGLDRLLRNEIETTGDLLLLDCVNMDARRLAELALLDVKLSSCAQRVVVVTNLECLDAVFACFDQTDPQFLVSPDRTDILLALSRAAAIGSGSRVREMSEEESMRLLKLSEQVDAIARRLDGSGDGAPRHSGLRDVKIAWNAESAASGMESAQFKNRPSLPDPNYVRRIIRQRQARSRFFDSELFGDPVWDMLLDLTAAHGEGKQVSVTSLCIASGVPATTALRWVKQLVETGVFKRTQDGTDRRRAFIGLSEQSLTAMSSYFAAFREEELAA